MSENYFSHGHSSGELGTQWPPIGTFKLIALELPYLSVDLYACTVLFILIPIPSFSNISQTIVLIYCTKCGFQNIVRNIVDYSMAKTPIDAINRYLRGRPHLDSISQ
jgi:hypothetical protein